MRTGHLDAGERAPAGCTMSLSILGAELGARHVAYVESVRAAFRELHVRIRNLRTGADRRVDRAASAARTPPTSPDRRTPRPGRAFVWARTNTASGRGNRLIRYTLRGAKLGYAQGSPLFNATAWAGGALGAATG